MKRFIITVLFLFTTVSLFSQPYQNRISSTAFEDGRQIFLNPRIGSFLLEDYPGAIPGTSNFWDYQTNGANLNGLVVRGDTIIVAYPSVDSTDPTGLTTRVAYYLVSENGGVTWSTPIAVQTLPLRSGYPEAYYYLNQGSPAVIISGRKYTSAGSRGGVWADAFWALGSFVTSTVPEPGRDFFGAPTSGNYYGGLFSSPQSTTPSIDTLFFCKYDFASNVMTGKTLIASPPNGIEGNVRYRFTAKGDNLFAMWYDNDTTTGINDYALRYKTSSDGGTSWSALSLLQMSRGFGGVVNGDTCSPWFGIDAAYKPGSGATWGAVWSTLYRLPSGGQSSGNNQGCKILFSAPGINGGLPVEVAGKSNMTIISDTSKFNDRGSLQVGVTPVSHPSIAYSSDGSRICVAFSAFQPGDTMTAGANVMTFNDIYVTYSDNGGLTWAAPQNLTNTHTWDELYPELSETGNTPTSFKIKFQATRGPGSQSFTDAAPTYRVYQAYKSFNPASIGINEISSEIPSKYSLQQNYPNPFNPVTKIRFNISKTTKVTLKVYNLLGQLVNTIVNNESVNPGVKEVSFDGSNLSSGIYFYSLVTSDGYKETKKMSLVK